MRLHKFLMLAAATAMLMTACGAKAESTTAAAETSVASTVEETDAAETDAAETDAETAENKADAEKTTETAASGQTSKIKSDRRVKFPEFAAKTLNGEEVTNEIFLQKELTVLNVWGTFCPPCIGEMPELGSWAREMPENVQLIGLICDIAGDEDTEHIELAHKIIDQANVQYMNIVANEDFYPILAEVTGVPTTIFIDGDGNIVGHVIVGADVPGYKKYVDELLDY